jgi:hypothetical protein
MSVLALLISFSKLASAGQFEEHSQKLKNIDNLQANKWQTYVIAILATPTSGHLIQIVQNEEISTHDQKMAS